MARLDKEPRVFHRDRDLVGKEDEQPLVLRCERVEAGARRGQNSEQLLIVQHRHPQRGADRRVGDNPARISRHVRQVERDASLRDPANQAAFRAERKTLVAQDIQFLEKTNPKLQAQVVPRGVVAEKSGVVGAQRFRCDRAE